MTLITWDDTMSVGIQRIDDQHKKLVVLINDLYEAVSAGKGSMVYDALFEELVDYFTTHFSTEEGLMASHNYPDYENHRTVHGGFISKVKELHKRASAGDKTVSEDALKFLMNWLINHDISMDKKLGAFLRERNVI